MGAELRETGRRGLAGIGKGDVVVAHGSERLMYVYDVVEQRSSVGYVCVWFEAGGLAESVFDAQALRRASEVHTFAA